MACALSPRRTAGDVGVGQREQGDLGTAAPGQENRIQRRAVGPSFDRWCNENRGICKDAAESE